MTAKCKNTGNDSNTNTDTTVSLPSSTFRISFSSFHTFPFEDFFPASGLLFFLSSQLLLSVSPSTCPEFDLYIYTHSSSCIRYNFFVAAGKKADLTHQTYSALQENQSETASETSYNGIKKLDGISSSDPFIRLLLFSS